MPIDSLSSMIAEAQRKGYGLCYCESWNLESLQAVDQVLDALAPKAREAFLLAHLEGLTYAAIAERLGVSMTSVKRYLMQAHRQCFLLALA